MSEVDVPSGRAEPSDEHSAMAARHTPGPWVWYSEDASMATLCRESDSAFGVDLEAHVLSVTICKNCQQGHKHWDWGRCYTAKAADARLIAASPELLDLVQHMLGAIEGNTIDSEQIDGDHEAGIPPHKWHEQWAYYARAAIAKAQP